jgi:hypothetical protein
VSPRPRQTPGFRWNADTQRYIGADGRFVSRERVRLALDQAIAKKSAEMRALANELRAGTISLDAWAARTRELVKDVNLYSAAVARGGWAQMTAADYGAVGRAVKMQYAYLDRFTGELYAGLPMDGRFLARVAMYAKSGRTLYSSMSAKAMRGAGYTEERNKLGVADHCTGPNSCVQQTARGWVAVGSLVPIGERQCLGNCECLIQYRRARDGAVA